MKRIITLLVALVTFLSLNVVSFAQDATYIVGIPSNWQAAVSAKFSEDSMLSEKWYGYIFYDSGAIWMENSIDLKRPSERMDIITEFVHDLRSWEFDGGNGDAKLLKQSIYTSLQNTLDDNLAAMIPELAEATSADLMAAYTWWMPFQGGFGIFLGIFVIFIIITLVGSTVADLVYLSSPSMIESISRDVSDGKKVWLVSRDAYNVARDEALARSKRNIYGIYFRRRWVTFLVIALCILYLISGQLGAIIQWLLGLASGITGQ